MRAVSPEERQAQERRQQITLAVIAGGVTLALLLGVAKTALDLRRWRADAAKDKPPWERGPGNA